MKLDKATTQELVDELMSRAGVQSTIVEPYKDETVKVNGPAIVLLVTD